MAAILCLSAAGPRGQVVRADPPAAPPPAEGRRGPPGTTQARLASLLADLDSSHYEVRQQAARKLEEWIARPEAGNLLAEEFQRLLRDPGISFEVRWRIVQWQARLPKPAVVPPPAASPAELDELVRQVDDDSYAVRLGAVERLRWLSGSPKLMGPILIRLKQRVADPDIPIDDYRRLDAVRQTIWGHWLTSGQGDLDLPSVSKEQLDRWLADLGRPAEKSQPALRPSRQQVARQELLDLLARDAEVPRVKTALEQRLAATTDADAAARLRELVDLCRPAMVAECWMGRQVIGRQHLLVGVPSQPPGAERPSHFDRIDDRVAHCVSGNSLSPGDYPVGVAIPHPKQAGAIFHLVNLSTPRRRMAYPYSSNTDPAQQLAAISRRTLERYLAAKHPLSEREACQLVQLDPREVSRFAGRYFQLVEDVLLDDDSSADIMGEDLPGERSSLHGTICAVLALDGTKDAAPGLLEAIEHKRLLPPTVLGPYLLAWVAALSIAARDPWPGADAWLAGVVGRRDSLPLVLEHRDGAELRATAARILLHRHRESTAPFSLQPVADSVLVSLHVEGYRFSRPEGVGRVTAWWKQRAVAGSQDPTPPQAP